MQGSKEHLHNEGLCKALHALMPHDHYLLSDCIGVCLKAAFKLTMLRCTSANSNCACPTAQNTLPSGSFRSTLSMVPLALSLLLR